MSSGDDPHHMDDPSRPKSIRSSVMSHQEDWIAKKKAEIEAKRQKLDVNSGSGSVQMYQSLTQSPKVAPGQQTRPKKGPLFGKNRWGFKGKKKEANPETSQQPPQPQLSLSNDGNFLERFKQMQQQSQLTKDGKTSTATDIEKNFIEVKQEKNNQEQEWYQQALSRARAIAQKTSVDTKPTDYSDSQSTQSTSKEVFPADSFKVEPQEDIELPTVADELASLVAVNGDAVEIMARERNLEEDELRFLQDEKCDLFKKYRRKVELLRRGFRDEGRRARKRTRWGAENEKIDVNQIQPSPQLAGKSPELISYAMKVFGTVDIEEHQWKQCSDQMKMSLVYQDLLAKQQRQEILQQKGKNQYEYDSDEDTEGGTWEHKARKLEMEKTAKEAHELTKAATGKHHIGDFLPPDELAKFLAKYEAVKRGEVYEESDYQENKLTDSNKGFKMLQNMGWSEGSGLGASQQGIQNPINQGSQSSDKKGLGVNKPHDLEQEDDEFDAYRKRMMLAYRFRPNPLNNPRRQYY